jgi:succinoglycan biosynthesis protein ExoM
LTFNTISTPALKLCMYKVVCVAIPTYRRIDRLKSLLDALLLQNVPLGVFVHVAVFDNDPEGGARAMVLTRSEGYRFPLHYRLVPEAGLAEVRNAALTFGSRAAQFIAMIDDDEIPEPQWLWELLRVCGNSCSDAVIGPVPRQFPTGAPQWLRAGNFFNDIPARADGSFVYEGHTGNCLLRVASLDRMKIRFDTSMNFAGGEDVLFFRELVAQGGRIAYAADARAVELVDAERLTPTHVMLRNLRTGNTLAHCDRKLRRQFVPLCGRLVKGLGRLTLGALELLPRTALQGFCGTMTALCASLRGCGMILGVAGVRVLEYRRP